MTGDPRSDRAAGGPPTEAATPAARAAIETARDCFLDDGHAFGCAETAFIVLKGAYGLDEPLDSSAALALNGGVAYSGGPCGALTGAALAVGILAGRRIQDHRVAKRMAREIVAGVLAAFVAEHGSSDCRDLIGYDLRAEGSHDRFIASGVWRTVCMRQIEFVVGRLAVLGDPAAWEQAVGAIEATGER
jgi:C_GCAxxG_C_C family probable redox protein